MRNVQDRLWHRVDKSGNCWLWTGAKSCGYGSIGTAPGKQEGVHRVVYQLLVGPIPIGATLDHQCHNQDRSCAGGVTCIHRACCNPAHLDVTTRGMNVLRGRGITAGNARKTHCPNGHPYSPENTHVTKMGFRQCRTCGRERSKRADFKRRWGDTRNYEDRRVLHYERDGRRVSNREL